MAKTDNSALSWEGEEYVQQEKNSIWYVYLVAIGLALVALSLQLRWWTFMVLVILSVVALIAYSLRPPRMLKYVLDSKGLKEGERVYNFDDYKAFGVIQDGKHFAIIMRPKKRFSPSVTVYFPESMGEEIVDAFGRKLPMEEFKPDILDKIVKFLRI